MGKNLIEYRGGIFSPSSMCQELSFLTTKFDGKNATVDSQYRTSTDAAINKYGFSTDVKFAELVYNLLGEIKTYAELFIGYARNGDTCVEYRTKADALSTLVLAREDSNGVVQFKAAYRDPSSGALSQYDADGHRGNAFIAALWKQITDNPEAASAFQNLRSACGSGNIDEQSVAMCKLSNNQYYRINRANGENPNDPVRYNAEYELLTDTDIANTTCNEVVCGSPLVFTISEDGIEEIEAEVEETEEVAEEVTEEVVTGADLRDKYKLDPKRELTPEEEARVPKMTKEYVVPAWATKIARRAASSMAMKKPQLNYLLYGPSGTGKTEGARAIAEMLGLPYYSLTCSADDDEFKLLGNLIPNVNKKDPSENDFVFVGSELIEAIKTGGLIELQEANTIKNASVMEALNPLFADDGGFIKLMTGEVITRHPDCVIVVTTNRGYEGTYDIQQAVWSRIKFVQKIVAPSAQELFDRAYAWTGFKPKAMLKKMAECVADIEEYCRNNQISSGVSGPRELINWATNAILEAQDRGTKVDEDAVIIAGIPTVLEKSAQNEEDIDDICSAIFKKYFSPSKVDAARAAA